MCIGNRAEVSSHYVNGQLRALYQNAQHCAKKHLNGYKPSSSAVEYATCLAEFYGPARHARQSSHEDLPFFALFDSPRVEFVCNHEVVLFLNIREGHFNLDINKATPKRDLNEAIGTCTLAFRIPFSSHAIEKFHCKAIGNAESYTAILHVLEMQSALFVSEHSSVAGLSDGSKQHEFYSKERKLAALTHYLTKLYLPTLKRAGHHVLYSLPDFDNLSSTTAYIDYSVISTRALATDTLFGVRVEDINVFLRGLWLQAAAFVDEYGHSPDTVAKSFLAELRMSPMDDVDDLHLHLYFGPLHVQPLCSREVILYLDIQDIHAHFGGYTGEPSEQLRDWKIAFIVDVTFEDIDQGSGKCIKLDINSARFCEHLSVFGEHYDIEIFTRIKTTLIHRITTYYISILETSETTVIFHHDKTIHGSVSGSDDASDDDVDDHLDVNGCSCEDEGSCGHTGGIRWGIIQRRILTQTYLGDFDLVTALTQGSINMHFKALWESARRRIAFMSGSKALQTWKNAELQLETCLADFSFVHPDHDDEVFFSANFLAPKAQLVCKEGSQSVIFYLHMTKGHLKTLGPGKSLQPGSDVYSFAHWRLAFEVDLQIIDSREDTTSSGILKRLGLDTPSGLRQLVLALSSAKLNLSLSTVPGLVDGTDYRAIRARREALAYYVQACYFPLLKRAHHHVLYTIPQTIPGSHNTGCVLTSLRFEIVPFKYASGAGHLEGLYGHYRAIFERNCIVIMGTTHGRPLPLGSLPHGINWVSGFGKDVPIGAVYLSRKSFLEGVLLGKLERINRRTTIVPTFSGIKDGRWVLQLAAWSDHIMKKDVECRWHEVTKNSDCLEFEWRNKDLWRYEHEDDFHNSGTYSINCVTHNVLTIPTSWVSKSVIQLKGVVKMHLKYESAGKEWNSEASVHWSANISFSSTPSGLQIQLHPVRVVPEIRSTQVTHGAPGHETQTQALAQLKEAFPDFIDFSILLGELKNELEGMWMAVQVQAHEFCVSRPVFNHRGDLVLDLVVRGTHVERSLGAHQTLNGKTSTMSLNGTATPVGMNGNGNATSEHWFRQVVHKAGDAISAYSPSISRMSSASKTTSTTFISEETITRHEAATSFHSNGDVEDLVESDVAEEL